MILRPLRRAIIESWTILSRRSPKLGRQSNHERSLEGLWDLDLESGGAYLLSIADGSLGWGPLESGATMSIMGKRTVG